MELRGLLTLSFMVVMERLVKVEPSKRFLTLRTGARCCLPTKTS